MTPLGLIIGVVEGAAKELLRDPTAGAPDLRNLAGKMKHAARQLRTLAECRPDAPRPRPVRSIGRASA